MAAKRVLVTRPAAQVAAWVERLGALAGVEALALPLIDIGPAPDPEAVRRAWRELDEQALVLFVSPSAVHGFFDAAPPGWAWPRGVLAAAPGPGSGAALQACGVPGSLLVLPPEHAGVFESMALWPQLGRLPWLDRKVLVVRGDGGRDDLLLRLREAGANVHTLAAYRRGCPKPTAAQVQLLAQAAGAPARHLWLLSSSEAVRHLQQMAPDAIGPEAQALCTHTRIAAAARAAGFGHVHETSPRVQDVRRAVKAWSIQS